MQKRLLFEEKKSFREMRREKKYPAEHAGGKKYPAHQVARKKKNLLTRNHPPLPPQKLNGRPLITLQC